jgi:hypothetical protein
MLRVSCFFGGPKAHGPLRAGLGGCPLISVADELKVVAGVVGYAAPLRQHAFSPLATFSTAVPFPVHLQRTDQRLLPHQVQGEICVNPLASGAIQN